MPTITPVLSSQIAGQKDFQKLFASNKKEVSVSKQITGLEETWNSKARANYLKAVELAQQGEHLVGAGRVQVAGGLVGQDEAGLA